MIQVNPILAFSDNYIWAITDGTKQVSDGKQANDGKQAKASDGKQPVAIVDPGDAQPVIAYLQQQQLTLAAIIITHHHHDHTGGIDGLLQQANSEQIPVYGPKESSIKQITHPLIEGDSFIVPKLLIKLTVIAVPGHTLDHIAYHDPVNHNLFCGDTLFAGGCGRVFEGSHKQMFNSLNKLKALPPNTLVYCAHEYTSANLKFAKTVEPNNLDLQQRIIATNKLRAKNLPTVPTTLKLELQTNPFLRVNNADDFATVRSNKDNF